ncbi:MAG: 3-phosphoshikimate 1-carboxyvinyltransferase [Prevotellaceae bacterium]|jgi:3-phosphoshikimate 1-carboxyvinyltransferase|nr:3-phosphoshikimate 1-carboxyvinyltransferase [Prevotellaceae bacterium]
MICLSIGIQGVDRVKEALFKAQMAEVRLDLTHLDKEETLTLFRSKKSLIATCRMYHLSPQESKERLLWAIQGSEIRRAGAKRYIDLDYDSPEEYRHELISFAKKAGFQVILSYHNFTSTDSFERLLEIYEIAKQRGADLVKIVTTVTSIEESARVIKLYQKVPPATLLAFALNKEGRFTRILSAFLGAPFIYCSLEEGAKTADGQYSMAEAKKILSAKGYPEIASRKGYVESVVAPASKSQTQRAILAAAWAKGESRLHHYTPCADSEAALALVQSLGVKVQMENRKGSDSTLLVKSTGIDKLAQSLPKNVVMDVGESGLLCRLMIPLSGLLMAKSDHIDSVTITGKGSLLKRKLFSDNRALNDMGLRVETNEGKLPAIIHGKMEGAHIKTSGKDGSQLLSGMLMSLPLCPKSTHIELAESTSIPYIDLTIKTLQEFGLTISHINFERFELAGNQTYKSNNSFSIDGDWSGASLLLVAGAICWGIVVNNLTINSQQSDEKILEILTSCGAGVEVEGSKIVISKPTKPLLPFEADATHFPDLFPSLVVLALNCNGTSRIKGIHRLVNKESNRAESLFCEFTKLGAKIGVENDSFVVEGGELHGGFCSSYNDHRIAMALITASLNIKEEVTVDNLRCISKSFPNFINNFY